MNKILIMFNDMYHFAYNIRRRETKSNGKINGRKIWNKIEKNIEHVDLSSLNLKYNSSLVSIYDKMSILIKEHDIVDELPNHFFLQLMNLVKVKSDFKIKLNRILQLALNIGQLEYSIFHGLIKEEIIDFYYKHKLNDINTYISSNDQKIISDYIKEHL